MLWISISQKLLQGLRCILFDKKFAKFSYLFLLTRVIEIILYKQHTAASHKHNNFKFNNYKHNNHCKHNSDESNSEVNTSCSSGSCGSWSCCWKHDINFECNFNSRCLGFDQPISALLADTYAWNLYSLWCFRFSQRI